MFDYHIHSTFSGDSIMSFEQVVNKALEIGLKEIVFTDHLDIYWPDKNITYEQMQPEIYQKRIEEAQNRYCNQISIKKGIEVGIQPHSIVESNNFLEKSAFDFIILSVHCIDGIDISKKDFFQEKSSLQACNRYYQEVLFAVDRFDKFSVLGHLDLIRRYVSDPLYSNPNYSDFCEIIDEILKILIKKNKGIEINTSGFRYRLNSFMPEFELIKRFRELGGKIITVGSDAHSIEYVGYKINEAIELAKTAGFEHITLFNDMNPHFYKI
ncbi:MAG: histidinol-phosphatase HisJ family protein [Ignavibacteriales bacterium]